MQVISRFFAVLFFVLLFFAVAFPLAVAPPPAHADYVVCTAPAASALTGTSDTQVWSCGSASTTKVYTVTVSHMVSSACGNGLGFSSTSTGNGGNAWTVAHADADLSASFHQHIVKANLLNGTTVANATLCAGGTHTLTNENNQVNARSTPFIVKTGGM